MHSGPVKQCVLLSQDVGMGSRTLARVMVCHLSVQGFLVFALTLGLTARRSRVKLV
jgi:hypothetical protein